MKNLLPSYEFAIKRRLDSSVRFLHYLDDYLGGHKTVSGHEQVMHKFQSCLQELSVPLPKEKTEGPTEVLCFFGLELDSVHMVVHISMPKIAKLVKKIEMVLAKEKVTLLKMQSLIGSLIFCCRAMIPGKPFCRRLINSICGLTKLFHHLRVSKPIRLDLEMWL